MYQFKFTIGMFYKHTYLISSAFTFVNKLNPVHGIQSCRKKQFHITRAKQVLPTPIFIVTYAFGRHSTNSVFFPKYKLINSAYKVQRQ